MPTGRVVVVTVAKNLPPAAGATLAVPSAVLPVVNATVPVGMPDPAKWMAAVKVTAPPVSTLYGLMNGVVMARVEVVGAVLTVTVRADEVLPAYELDPR